MTTLWKDLLYGLHGLVQKPIFTITAVLSLALGIGANTAVFSMVDAMLLKSLPFKHPDRLVFIWTQPIQHPDEFNGAMVPDYVAWKARTTLFEPFGGANGTESDFGAHENGALAERIEGETYSPEIFATLGVAPMRGRTFTAEEDRIDQPDPVLLISHRLWQKRFGGDPGILGKVIRVDGTPTKIIGVMPSGFYLFSPTAEFWSPLAINRFQLEGSGRFLVVPARLKPGVTIQQAQAEMDAIAVQLAKERPDRYMDAGRQAWGIKVQDLREGIINDLKPRLLVLQGTVGLVLLIACANVAGLLLARASSRRVEVSIRAALGASRIRIIRQLLTESVLLSAIGGILGIAIAELGLKGLVAISPPWFPHLEDVTLDNRILLFTATLSILAGLLFGLVPAFQASKIDLSGALKEAGRSAVTAGTARQGLRSVLVAVEIAVALVLLIGAGLMIHSFMKLQNADIGMDPQGLLTFGYALPQNQFIKPVGSYHGFPLLDVSEQLRLQFDRVLERLRTIPGVTSVAGTPYLPLFYSADMTVLIDGRAAPSSAAERDAQSASNLPVSPGFFSTLRIPILRGRDITERDTASSPWVAAVNETMAKRFWPGEDPIGKRFRQDFAPAEQPIEIVALVGDTPSDRMQNKKQAIFYTSFVQRPSRDRGPWGWARAQMNFFVRTDGDPLRLSQAVRSAVAEVDPDRPLNSLGSFESRLGNQLNYERWYMLMLAVFGGVALLLASVGIYGVMAYSVAQRTHEIGMRMALGASSWDVLALMLRRAMVLIGGGVLLGLAGAFALTRLLAQQLRGVSPTDPPTFASVSLILVPVALAACWIPTRKASSVDPTVALRYE